MPQPAALPAACRAAGTQAFSPLFLQLPAGEGALAQRPAWVSPAWPCSLGNSGSQHGGMLQAQTDRAETPLPRWVEVPPWLRAALQRAQLAQLLRPAVSSQRLPSPGLTTAPALRSTAARSPAASGQLGSAPRAGRRGTRRLGSHTALSLCPFPAHRPPEGVEGARVTLLPSLKLLLKELRRRNPVSVPPVPALPPQPAPAQQHLHGFSPSALFPLPRRRHSMPAAWRSWSRARQR